MPGIRSLLPLNKNNPFDKFQQGPASENNWSTFGNINHVTDLRNASKGWERTKSAQVSGWRDHALTEKQLLTTLPFVPAFDVARKTMSQCSPLEVMNSLVC